MATRHFSAADAARPLRPADLGLVYTSVQRLELKTGGVQTLSVDSGSEEICLVVIEGEVAFSHLADKGQATLGDMLYLPVDSRITLSGGPAALMRFGAPCARPTRFAHIRFSEVDADERHKTYGKSESGTRRDVWNFIDERFDSSRFLIGICYGAPGGWTAWPPHEHGDKREETYVYFNMGGDGFALQCVYDELRPDAPLLVRNGDVVPIPAGYHPNVGCPKTGIRYVYCMVSREAEDRNFMDLRTQAAYGERLE